MVESKRPRRTADEARRLILDAAEKRLAEAGPDGIRLQQIAADVGISHPAVLHHFGTRGDLIDQVVQRAAENLERTIVESFAHLQESDSLAMHEILKLTARGLVDSGHARVVTWLSLSGHPFETATRLKSIAEVAHAHRLAVHDKDASYEDTLFEVLLVTFALFGEAVVGSTMRTSAGLPDDADTRGRFYAWLAELLRAREANCT